LKNALIIFIKNPVKGRVKTRLAKELGEDEALNVYHILCDLTRKAALHFQGDKYLFYSDEVVFEDGWDETHFIKHKQEGQDLGERISNAFKNVIGRYESMLIIGSDCPYLKEIHLKQAIDKLQECDCVMGPAADGGYYLLGIKKMIPGLFSDKSWSEGSLLAETKACLNSLNQSYFFLETLEDVDDLAAWERYLAS
jgi:rSAM/selenodomain-associated transferase 1